MDNAQMLKREITDAVTSEIKSLLKEIEPLVIDRITEDVEMKYIQQIYAQESEIAMLKERITKLEETILWATHNVGIDV